MTKPEDDLPKTGGSTTNLYDFTVLQRLQKEGLIPKEVIDPSKSDESEVTGIQGGFKKALQENCGSPDLKSDFSKLLDDTMFGDSRIITLTPKLFENNNFEALIEMGGTPDETNYQIYEFALKAPNGKALGTVHCYAHSFITQTWKIEIFKV